MAAVATSGLTLYSRSRDQILTRALRICGAYGQGETPETNAVTEAAEALNVLVKSLSADGMPLWKVKVTTPFTLTATQTYNIGTGSTVNSVAPNRVIQAFIRDSLPTIPTDTPMLLITKEQYVRLSPKTSTGRPNQLWYDPPGAGIITVSDLKGIITIFPKPDTYSIANLTIGMVVELPFEDFNASTDVPDFPSYWYNALTWLLAAELCFEYGLGLSERGMILKKADREHLLALSAGTEEGSLFVSPMPNWTQHG